MEPNGAAYSLTWIGWDEDVIETLELALVVRCKDHKLIGEVQIIREMFQDSVVFCVELVGEEERGFDHASTKSRASTTIKRLRKIVPKDVRISNSRKGAFLRFPLLKRLPRNSITTPEDLTRLILPGITNIMDAYFQDYEFSRTLRE